MVLIYFMSAMRWQRKQASFIRKYEHWAKMRASCPYPHIKLKQMWKLSLILAPCQTNWSTQKSMNQWYPPQKNTVLLSSQKTWGSQWRTDEKAEFCSHLWWIWGFLWLITVCQIQHSERNCVSVICKINNYLACIIWASHSYSPQKDTMTNWREGWFLCTLMMNLLFSLIQYTS